MGGPLLGVLHTASLTFPATKGLVAVGCSDREDQQTGWSISLRRSTGRRDGLKQQCLSHSSPTGASSLRRVFGDARDPRRQGVQLGT